MFSVGDENSGMTRSEGFHLMTNIEIIAQKTFLTYMYVVMFFFFA